MYMWLKLILPFWRTCTSGWFVTHWLLCMKQKRAKTKTDMQIDVKKKKYILLYCRSLCCSCVWLLLKKCHDKSPLVCKELQENSWTFEMNNSATRTNSDNATSLCSHCGNASKTMNLLYGRFLFLLCRTEEWVCFMKEKKVKF